MFAYDCQDEGWLFFPSTSFTSPFCLSVSNDTSGFPIFSALGKDESTLLFL